MVYRKTETSPATDSDGEEEIESDTVEQSDDPPRTSVKRPASEDVGKYN